MTDLRSSGISVTLPQGWEGVIYRRHVDEVSYEENVPMSRRQQPNATAITHLANFPLPAERGDYGSGAVEIMGDSHVFMALFEFDPESAAQPLFSEPGPPRRLRPGDFDPKVMQRPLPGMAGTQRFFNVGGARAFCLYVVIGSWAERRTLAQQASAVLEQIEIEPR